MPKLIAHFSVLQHNVDKVFDLSVKLRREICKLKNYTGKTSIYLK